MIETLPSGGRDPLSMSLSLNRFSLKATPPRVVLLPDSLFFCRVVPISDAATEAEVTAQIDLALESLSPFPLSQLFYGHRWVEGARHALVYACYRKRFTTEQMDAWAEAEAVLPRFAALLVAPVEPATTLVSTNDDGITAIHWGENRIIPEAIVSRPWLADTGELERRRLREEIVKSFGGTRSTIELTAEPTPHRDGGATEIGFRSGENDGVFSREQLDALDVRDKTELSSRRRARAQGLFLWRAFLTCVFAVALSAVLEIALIGGHVWQRSRQHRVDKQAPVVADIMRSQALSTHIQELSTNRLRPFEMIGLAQSKKPASVTFLRVTTTGVHTLEVDAYTNTPPDVGVYQSALRTIPELSQVDVNNLNTRDRVSTFRLVLTFRPGAFHTN